MSVVCEVSVCRLVCHTTLGRIFGPAPALARKRIQAVSQELILLLLVVCSRLKKLEAIASRHLLTLCKRPSSVCCQR